MFSTHIIGWAICHWLLEVLVFPPRLTESHSSSKTSAIGTKESCDLSLLSIMRNMPICSTVQLESC